MRRSLLCLLAKHDRFSKIYFGYHPPPHQYITTGLAIHASVKGRRYGADAWVDKSMKALVPVTVFTLHHWGNRSRAVSSWLTDSTPSCRQLPQTPSSPPMVKVSVAWGVGCCGKWMVSEDYYSANLHARHENIDPVREQGTHAFLLLTHDRFSSVATLMNLVKIRPCCCLSRMLSSKDGRTERFMLGMHTKSPPTPQQTASGVWCFAPTEACVARSART